MKVNLIATPNERFYNSYPKHYAWCGISKDKEYMILKIRTTKYTRFVTLINDEGRLIEKEADMFDFKTV